eukprot:COSAG02_NODE_1902_length_10451_cov_6.077763_8_plen_267_part_00
MRVQIPIKSPQSEAAPVPRQRKKQLEAEKQTQRQLKKEHRKAEKAAETARAAAIANMAGTDVDAVLNANPSRDLESKKLKRRKREHTAGKEQKQPDQDGPMHAWTDASDEDVAEDGGDARLTGAAEAQSAREDNTAAAAMDDDPVESGQYEELRQQYELVKDDLGEEERAELEQELKELYEMEADPTGRGVEGAILDAPLSKKKQKKKKKKRKVGSAADTELSSALEIAEEVAARRDSEQEKVVSKEESKRACVCRRACFPVCACL